FVFALRTTTVRPRRGRSKRKSSYLASGSPKLKLILDWKNVARRFVHSAVRAKVEKLKTHRTVAFEFSGTKREQRSPVAITKQCDVKRRLRAIPAHAHVAVLLVDSRVVQSLTGWSLQRPVR